MSGTNDLETALLKWVFNSTLPSWSTSTGFYISLHTAEPGEAGSQIDSETTYTAYARVFVDRFTSTGWTVSNNIAFNTSAISFATPTGGTTGAGLTHFGIGTVATATGILLFYGPLAQTLSLSTSTNPTFDSSALTITSS